MSTLYATNEVWRTPYTHTYILDLEAGDYFSLWFKVGYGLWNIDSGGKYIIEKIN